MAGAELFKLYSMNRIFWLCAIMLVAVFSAGCGKKTATLSPPKVDYTGSYGRLIVCADLKTGFSCPSQQCNENKTAYIIDPMPALTWNDFLQALMVDRTAAPLAGKIEGATGQASQETDSTITYNLGESWKYSGSGLNYDQFDAQFTKYIGEVIAGKKYSSTGDPSILVAADFCK